MHSQTHLTMGNGMGIASMAIGAAQGLGNMISQAVQNRKNRKFQQDMYNQQKADNLKFWEMENQYNSPVMQMQRLKDAGLNPNLVYGSGANAQGGNISAPSQNVSDQKAPQMPDASFLMDMYNMKKIDAQTDLTRQQIENNIANEKLATGSLAIQNLTKARMQTDNQYLAESLDDRIKQISAALGLTTQQTRTSAAVEDNTKQTTLNQAQDLLFKAENQKWTVKQLIAQLAKIQAETALTKANTGLTASNTRLTNQKQIEQSWVNHFAKKGIRIGEHITSSGVKEYMELIKSFLK